MRLPHRARRLTTLLQAALVASAAAQETLDLPGVFSEVLVVRVVDVEVVVSDALGHRVLGLGRDDFRITVDAAPRAVDFFTEIRDGEMRSPQPAANALEDNAAEARLAAEAHSTSYLVFIDDAFTRSRDRNLVLEKLNADLERLGPRDRMAVVAFDGRELTLLSAWTGSARVLGGALRDARARPTGWARRERERRLNELTPGGSAGTQLSGMQHRYARRLGIQLEQAVMAAVASLRSFPSPPGRKAMLLLSGAWPLSPAEFAIGRSHPPEAALSNAYASGVLGYEDLYGPLVDTANLLGYTLYPVDVPGTAGQIDPEVPVGLLPGTGDASFWGPAGNLHAGMRFLAERTGGRAIVNHDREEALASVADDTRSYYSLAFRLERAADDARHEIRVEVLRPGLEARFREGFVDLSRASEMTLMSESALLFGNPASPLAAQLRFGRPLPAGRGVVRIPLEIGFPLDDIALVESGDRRSAELALRVVTLDDEGSRTQPRLETVTIELRRQPQPGELYWHSTELVLARRWHRVVAGVFDPHSGRIYSSSAEIAP